MTLLNLLKQHLAEWPEGVTVIVQDGVKEVRGQCLKQIGGEMCWAHRPLYIDCELADGYETACVARDQRATD